MKEDDPLRKILSDDEIAELEQQEGTKKSGAVKAPKVAASVKETKKEKSEEVAMETPQDRFRKIINDSGYKTGVENLTSYFFSGNTDSPDWLDYTLKIANIPAKNREIILSLYYGKTIEDLGIKIDSLSIKSKDEKKIESDKAAATKDDSFDLSKIADDDLKEYIKNEKTETAMEMMKARKEKAIADREEAEERRNNRKNPQATSVMMRQIQRPVIVNGAPLLNKEGAMVYETIQEPVPNGQNNSGDNMTGIAAIIAALMPRVNPQGSGDSDVAKAITAMNAKIESIQKNTELQAKEDEIKRLNERIDREKVESKRDLEKEKESMKERLDKIEADRLRDLTSLKERFNESIQHKKELDDVIGQISGAHKKEIDGLKQKLEHTQTNIERTIVSKGTETLDGVTKQVGNIAKEVITPMAEVMKDHYRTIIDQTRIAGGLPPLKDSLPKVSESELELFARGE